MKITKITDISYVEDLLGRSSLPTSDLKSNDKIQLFGTCQNEKLIACIGVEIYSDVALLRSLAVDSTHKKQGIGGQLLEFIENFCEVNGVKKIFLFTETAEKYFEKLGFAFHKREEAPLSIKGTTQFSSLCPISSKFMIKILKS